MIATNFEITNRKKVNPITFADISDFELRERGKIDAEEILNHQHITLYSLDFQNGQAVFVETPREVDLSQVPFFYQAQRDHALRVTTVPFETMIPLAQCVSVDDTKLIHIYSMGRSGSTLASKILAQGEGVVNISEPDTLTQLVAARFPAAREGNGIEAHPGCIHSPAVQDTCLNRLGAQGPQLGHRAGRLAA